MTTHDTEALVAQAREAVSLARSMNAYGVHAQIIDGLLAALSGAEAPAQGWRELQEWLMGQRIALEQSDPDFFAKHDTLKAVGNKVRELALHAAPQQEGR